MGNSACQEAYEMGREVGVIPNPHMDRSFTGYLSLNSSNLLRSDYAEVRRSLSPDQLGVFNHSLQATLGESGRVTRGGVGVVALALSFLFDDLARQAKNETGSTHFVPRVFGGSGGDNGSEIGAVVSDYLRLVPLIANDPQRMKAETERYEQRLNRTLVGHLETTLKVQNHSWTDWKVLLHGLAFHQHMMIHQVRMGAEIPMEQLMEKDWEEYIRSLDKYSPRTENPPEIGNALERLRSFSPKGQRKSKECTEEDFAKHFSLDLVFSGTFFFMDFSAKGPQYISQEDDFFY